MAKFPNFQKYDNFIVFHQRQQQQQQKNNEQIAINKNVIYI